MKLYIYVLLVSLMVWIIKTKETLPTREINILQHLTSFLPNNSQLSRDKHFPKKRSMDDVEKSEKLNRGFDKIIQFVNVLGQIDNFISDRTKSIIHKLNTIYNAEENNSRSRKNPGT